MTKLSKIFILTLMIFNVFQLHAQDSKNTKSVGTLQGKVIDIDTQNPVEYATVALFSKTDELITGNVSDLSGNFMLEGITFGIYYLVIDFIGYEKMTIPDIKLSRNSPNTKVEIQLKRADSEIGEVTVVAEKNLIDFQIDKKVVNVEKNISAAGGTAVDALQNVPSIDTDIEGNVTLRGSSEYTVLIDGRPTILESSDALNQMPASLIKSIEIITNPSAKYDPDGTAGIINIITKKEGSSGFTGLVNLSYGTGPLYAGDVFFKLTGKKYSISGGIDYNDRSFDMEYYTDQLSFFSDRTESLIYEGEKTVRRDRAGINAAFDYKLTKNNTLSLQAKYNMTGMSLNSNTFNTYQYQSAGPEEYFFTNDVMNINPESYQLTIGNIHKFNGNGHELSTSFNFSSTNALKNEHLIIYDSDINHNLFGTTEDALRVNNDAWNKYRFEIDYSLPMNERGKIEAGLQYRFYDSESDYIGNFSFNDADNLSETDISDFNRKIYAAYGTYSNAFGKFEMKLGLRTEFTDRELNQQTINNTYSYENFDFYPSAYFTYHIDKSQQFQLNYSKRLNRPKERALNPYIFYSDGFSAMKGNPELEPEYANLAEFNYMKIHKLGLVSLEVFYRQTTNKIARYGELNDNGILEYSWGNIDKDVSIGAELMSNTNLTKWWTLDLNASLFKYKLEGDYSGENVNRESMNWDANITAGFKLKTNTVFQLMGMYKSPTVTIEGEREAMYFAGAGIKQDFFKRKLSVMFNIQDIFQTRYKITTTETSSYYIFNEKHRLAPIATIKLSYKINSFKQDKVKTKDETGDYDIFID